MIVTLCLAVARRRAGGTRLDDLIAVPERYDRAETDIFALQAEIIEQAHRKPPGSLEAYELLVLRRNNCVGMR